MHAGGQRARDLAGEVSAQDPWGAVARGQYALLRLHDPQAAKAKVLRTRMSTPSFARWLTLPASADTRPIAGEGIDGESAVELAHSGRLRHRGPAGDRAVRAADHVLGLSLLLVYRLVQRALGISRTARDAGAVALPLLVVIPSLLRQRDELTSMQSTVESIASNGYPGELTIVITIDGNADAPILYAELRRWARNRPCVQPALYITGTQARRSKPMAIDHAMEFVKGLVSNGYLAEFPPAYVSTDADADLGPNALYRIVCRLQRRNRITGWPARGGGRIAARARQ